MDFAYGKSLLGDALVLKAMISHTTPLDERLALLREAEPLIKGTLNGSEYLPGANTNILHNAMIYHQRLYATWNALSPSAGRAALATKSKERAAGWIASTDLYNRVQVLWKERKYREAEILCRQIVTHNRAEQTNASPHRDFKSHQIYSS